MGAKAAEKRTLADCPAAFEGNRTSGGGYYCFTTGSWCTLKMSSNNLTRPAKPRVFRLALASSPVPPHVKRLRLDLAAFSSDANGFEIWHNRGINESRPSWGNLSLHCRPPYAP